MEFTVNHPRSARCLPVTLEFPPFRRPLEIRCMPRYFTFTQQSGANRIPVRTLDYLFAAPSVTIERYSVEQQGMLKVSDHLPLVADFILP